MGFYDIEWSNCYQVSMVQEYLGQMVINRFFYHVQEEQPVSLELISTVFYGQWNIYAPPIQSQDCLYKFVRVLELFGNRQTYEGDVTGGNGSQGVAELPAFFVYRFGLVPLDTRVKKGRKAVSGMLEEMIDGAGIAAAYQTDFNDFATFIALPITVSSKTLLPSLLSPANTRHPTNIITTIVDGTLRGWSTQSSRKPGRGA